MPNFTVAELESLVDQGRIVGLALDTTEFFHVNYNYESPSFKALGQFAGTGISVVFPEVVLNEVYADVRDDIGKKTELVRAGLKQVSKAARLEMDAKQLIANLGIPDASARSKELLDGFIDKIGAVRVPVDEGPTVRKLHDLYFAAQPPFSTKAEKKNEFPDAIALLSLEHWAQQNEGFVLAVSGDSDWFRFAEESQHIICVKKLSLVLNLFNRNDEVVAGRLSANLAAKTATNLIEGINKILARSVETFEFEANAPYYYDADDLEATIDNWDVANDRFDVLDSDEESVTIAFNVVVVATFSAYFSFEVRDGIDKDYVSIGGTHAATKETFDLQIVATVGRADDDPNPKVIDLECEGPSIGVDFGYVEVDYGDDYYGGDYEF